MTELTPEKILMLEKWISAQRAELPEKIALLEEINGWTWDDTEEEL